MGHYDECYEAEEAARQKKLDEYRGKNDLS